MGGAVMHPWEIVGYVILAGLAIVVLINLHDIKRYIRMKTM